jgi:hypothetical protein
LSVVRAIANAHHGDAIVRPGESGGVTVEISLPLDGGCSKSLTYTQAGVTSVLDPKQTLNR